MQTINLLISVNAGGVVQIDLNKDLIEEALITQVIALLDTAVLRLRFNSVRRDGQQVVERRHLFRSANSS